jgi:ABC-2 type transport system ATP-binding protein
VGIDAQARSNILELIRRLNAEGLTVLYTTHYLEEAEQLCHRIGVIDRGKLVALGDKEDLIRQIGDEDTVRFRLDEDAWEAFADAARHWPAGHEVRYERQLVTLRSTDGAAVLPVIQDWHAARSLALAHLEVERPNLETLYLNLTGRALRE